MISKEPGCLSREVMVPTRPMLFPAPDMLGASGDLAGTSSVTCQKAVNNGVLISIIRLSVYYTIYLCPGVPGILSRIDRTPAYNPLYNYSGRL